MFFCFPDDDDHDPHQQLQLPSLLFPHQIARFNFTDYENYE